MRVAIALGGGAPNLTLMTGALLALDEAGVDFHVVTTTGAGMVAGLLYAAPRRESEDETWKQARQRQLAETREMGIDDAIYNQFPVNYKIFQKTGHMAEAYAHAVNPTVWGIPRDSRRRRLLGDSLGFFAAMMQPSDLSADSHGLCQPPPWISLMVDFDELQQNMKNGDKCFSLSAYCIEDQKERTFTKEEITEEHFKAGLAMPFLYTPYKLQDGGEEKTFLEGSAIRTMQFNPDNVMQDEEVDTLIYFDLMGNRHLMAEPKNLVDAWGKSIVAPLTQLAYLQEQLVYLKRYACNAMISDTNIILNYDQMTVGIEDLLHSLDTSGNKEMADLVDKIGSIIDDARMKRKDLLDQSQEDLSNITPALEINEERSKGLAKKEPRLPEKARPLLEKVKEARSELAQSAEGSETTSKDGKGIKPSHDLQRERNLLRYAEFTLDELKNISNMGRETIHIDRPAMLRMPFRNRISEERWEKVLDWSHSNMSDLFDIGYDTAQDFLQEHWEQLGLKKRPPKKPQRSNTSIHIPDEAEQA
ncbi:MAG: patatin-like phospholipase family protein [Hyphomicrobiales bacterium]|nr:patatin-like phospholipase family protein [Hyphomicrobiales bacterium]